MTFPQPVLSPINDREFALAQDYAYTWEHEGQRYRVTAFAGFVTDCASIPRVFWTFAGVLPTGTHSGAAVIHDLMYQWRGQPQPPGGKFEVWNPYRKGWETCEARWERSECDRLFLRMMKEGGSVKWKRTVMFYAVAWFGGAAWSR